MNDSDFPYDFTTAECESAYTHSMEAEQWYAALIKPSWAPPAFLFGPVWTVLYIGIALSFGRVFLLAIRKQIPRTVAIPFILNLAANAAFSPLQFTLRSNVLAAFDITLVLGTLIWAMIAIYPHSRLLTWAQIPYLLWVTFATVLQFTVTALNPL